MKLFCAQCNAVTNREVYTDHNGEVVATCGCGRFLKFPAAFKPPEPTPKEQSNDSEPAKVPLWRKIFG